jgi:ribosomal protein L11 methyltransferase
LAWLELTLRLRAEVLPRAEALLELAGAVSIAFSDAGDAPILEPAPGTTPLWPAIEVRALFADGADPAAIVALVGPLAEGEPTVSRIDAADIEARTRAPIVPLQIGPRLAVVPAESLPDADDRALGLHMGLAFGTGSHPTTRLCLEWIERELEPGISVLDYGAGSGILALAALKLGAAHATATDTEPQALAAAGRNARLNDLEESLTIGPPEAVPALHFDLIVANILARPLIELAETFAGHQSAGGRIVLSGVLDSQLPELKSRYAAWYEAFATRQLAGWGLLTGVRRAV